MREVVNVAVGKSLITRGLSNAAMIRGIQVDNPTGGWLYLVGEQVYVPPYTIGWALPMTYDQSSITINFGNGPQGQPGTLDGASTWDVILFDETIEQSSGSNFQTVETSLQPVFRSGTDAVNLAGVSLTEVSGVAGKRIRVYSVRACFDPQSVYYQMSPVHAFWNDDLGNNLADGIVSFNTEVQFDYLNGFDLPVGNSLTLAMASRWATVSILHSVTYRYV